MSARPAAPAAPAALAAALAALALSTLATRPAEAHPLDLGYLRIEASGAALTATLDLDAAAAAHLLGTGALALDAPTLRARASDLADATLRRAELATDLGP